MTVKTEQTPWLPEMERAALIYAGLAQRRTGLPARTGRQNGEDFKGKGDDNGMAEKSFMTVEEVAAELRVSKSKAYQIVRELNAELQKQGYLTVAGRVNATFFHKKVCYSD